LGCVQAERIALIEQLLGGTTAQSRTGGVLERYERRALSRRKCATETFMAINHMP
jgi:hypothetical protein